MRRLCTLDPDNRHESNNHAAVLMRMHRFGEARVILLENLDRHGPSENVLCNLANATACLGEQDEAVEIARQAIERDPSAVLPRRALCSVLPYCDGHIGNDAAGGDAGLFRRSAAHAATGMRKQPRTRTGR